MGFFFADNKAQAKAKPAKKARLQDIPVDSLRKLSCEVCPRAEDKSLRAPKMRPGGPDRAPIYLLGSAPSTEDDDEDSHWMDKAGGAVYDMFGREYMQRFVRSNYIQQCKGDQTNVVVECCRNRIIADIESCKPEIIVCVGDGPLQWCLGHSVGNALTNRGTLFVARIGTHVCHVFSLIYPNYVHKKSYGRSEYELALQHDVAWIKEQSGQLFAPKVYSAPYDEGVQIITGDEPGDMERLVRALERAAREPHSGVDLETNGLRPYMLPDARILTAAVGTFEATVAFPILHPSAWGTERRRQEVKALFRDYLLSSGRKAAHGLSFEMEWIGHHYGESILRRTEWDDTMAMAHTSDERPGTKSLNHQTMIHFGFPLKEQSPIDVTRAQWWTQYNLPQILRYNGMDTKWTDLLRRTYQPMLEADPKQIAEYERKVRLAPTLIQTQSVGLLVDVAYAEKQLEGLTSNIAEVERRLKRLPEIKRYEQRFGTFSATNPDHVLRLYKEVEKRDEIRVEEKDGVIRWTTDEEALAKIELESAKLVLQHRESSKQASTYVIPVIERKIVCPDGRIRCRYDQLEARTGRLASDDPNIQNWPNRKHKNIRGIIVPPPGHWMVPCDYAQIEFRVVGMASEDRNLVKYCWTGYDVHGYWAQRFIEEYGPIKDYIWNEFQDVIQGLLKKDPDEDKAISKTLRQESKNGWVFPMFFGSSARSCANNLHVPQEIADKMAREFWDEFKGVKGWQERLVKSYERTLYVETLAGRKRRGALSLNQVINHPIQGTALDIVTEAQNALSERADREGDPEYQPVLNVHDDLTFYIADSSLDTKIPEIAREMCLPRFDYINVPLIVEVSAGDRWSTKEEIRKYSSTDLFNITNPYRN